MGTGLTRISLENTKNGTEVDVIMATVKLFGNLRSIAGSHQQVAGSSVRVVVDRLCEDNPPLCELLLADGAVRQHFKITLNGHDIALAQGLDTPVSEGDQIAIFSPIAGG